jgi:nitrate reductase cytochrome c-type subunit
MRCFKRVRGLPFGIGLIAAVAFAGVGVADGPGAAGLATGEPGMNVYPSGGPGETRPLERPYEIAPPLVPHDVSGLVVNRAGNDCLDCHLDGMEVDEGHVATRIPPSHHENPRTHERVVDGVVGTRYNCLQCHVPQGVAARDR